MTFLIFRTKSMWVSMGNVASIIRSSTLTAECKVDLSGLDGIRAGNMGYAGITRHWNRR